jgi:hypothetical protein
MAKTAVNRAGFDHSKHVVQAKEGDTKYLMQGGKKFTYAELDPYSKRYLPEPRELKDPTSLEDIDPRKVLSQLYIGVQMEMATLREMVSYIKRRTDELETIMPRIKEMVKIDAKKSK